MDWSVVLIVVGGVVTLGVALMAFGVLNSLGFGPDHDPSTSGQEEELNGSSD